MKKLIARISLLVVTTCALLVICSTTAGQDKTEVSDKYGPGGKKITTKSKSNDGDIETQTKYYDAKGKLREDGTVKTTRTGETEEVEYYDDKGRKTKRTKDTFDICGIRTTEQTEHYGDGVLSSGEIIEWGNDELQPKSVKEWDPVKQRYEERSVDEWMRENYPWIEKGLELKFGARTTSGCQYGLAQNANGLSTLALNTGYGKISVNLPDDLAAGDTFSGTVVAEPSGSSQAERDRNREQLNRYSLHIGSKQIRVAERLFAEAVGNRDETLKLVVTDSDGRVGGHVSLRLDVPASVDTSFQFPRLGQAGRLVRIKGPCDGDLKTTHVKIGGAEVPPLAESPRQVVVQSPAGLAGPTEIEIEESGRAGRAPFRNVAINLSAPKTNLLKGEQTTLTVRVTGLQGLQEDLPIDLENKSPTVVSVAGGDEQTITVHAGDISAGGYSTERALTGVRPGGFTILATLWIGDDLDLPGSATERKAVIEKWRKYWQAMRDVEAAKQAAAEADKVAKAAEETATKAAEEARNLKDTSKKQEAEDNANKAKREADQKKAEAESRKENAAAKATAAGDAKTALDQAEQKISDKSALKGVYADKAKELADVAEQAQKAADAFQNKLKTQGNSTDSELKEAADLQKKADDKKAEAEALKKYGDAIKPAN